MNRPTTKQYEDAIANRLTRRQIEILQVIYHRPNSAATAIELAEDMGYKGFQGSNRQIGAIGQAIVEQTGVQPHTYLYGDTERPSYYYFVGDYNGPGWKLWPELKKALENLDLVSEKVSKTGYTERLPNEVLPFEEKNCIKKVK